MCCNQRVLPHRSGYCYNIREGRITMKISDFPVSREPAPDDGEPLSPLFSELQPRMSELTFANLFLFRVPHAYRLTRLGGSVVILGRGWAGGEYFLPPV